MLLNRLSDNAREILPPVIRTLIPTTKHGVHYQIALCTARANFFRDQADLPKRASGSAVKQLNAPVPNRQSITNADRPADVIKGLFGIGVI